MKKNLISAVAASVVISSFVTYSFCSGTVRDLVVADKTYNADVDGDGNVNVMDLNIIKKILLGDNISDQPDQPAETDTPVTPVPPEDTEDDQLTILCWNSNDSLPMVNLFCKETGTDPSMINIKDFNCAGSQAEEMYERYLSDPSNDADIMFLEADWCLDYINDDSKTLPLSELGYSDSDFSDIYNYIVETGRSTNTGELKAISWQASVGGYCYRTDLAEKYLGVRTPDEMQAKIRDWNNFLATAEELRKAGGPAISATLGGVMRTYSFSRPDAWIDADNKVKADDYCINYFDFAKKLMDNGYVTNVSQWTDMWKPLGQTDDVMGYYVPTWGFGETILTGAAGGERGATFGKWNVCIGPQEYYWGGTWMAPSSRINNRKLAKQFIDFFTIDEESAEAYAVKQDEFMSNRKVMQSVISGNKYYGAPVLGGQNQFEVLSKVADGIDVKGKITPYDAVIRNSLSYAAQKYCDESNDSVFTVYDSLEYFVNNVNSSLYDKLNQEVVYEFGPDWRSLYLTEIKKAAALNRNVMFDYCDVNGDHIPELFISDGEAHVSGVSVYTIVNNKVVNAASGGSYGEIVFCKDQNVLLSYYYGMGMEYSTYFAVIDGQKVVVAEFENNAGAVPDPEDAYYKVNGEIVSKSEFEAELKKYQGNRIALGRKYSLN